MSCYRFIREHRRQYPVVVMCEVLGVSKSGYYGWLGRGPSTRDQRRARLGLEVRRVYEDTHGIYGSRKVAEELVQRSVDVCRNTVARLMREMNLRSRAQKRRSFVVTTDSNHADPIAPNRLGRDFTASAPDRKWVADLTYVPTAEGWAYVAAVLDLFSRRVVGWAVGDSLGSGLVLEALESALEARRPGAGLVHHSDRGCQYAGGAHRALLEAHGIECSMSRRGDCWDNAPAERFMNSLKNEWTEHYAYRNVEEVHRSVFKYIEIFYNRARLHQALGYVTPVEFENKHSGTNAA